MRQSELQRLWNLGKRCFPISFISGKKCAVAKDLLRLAGVTSVLLALLFGGCQGTRPEIVSEEVVTRTPVALASGDVIKFTFLGAPEFNQSQKVRADGKVSLPLVGEVVVSGKRPGELQEELGQIYKAQLQNNSIVLTLENTSAMVYVSGAVLKPGKIIVDRPMTVFEAIMETGGFEQDYANTKKVMLLRHENGHQATYTFDLSPAFKGQPFSSFYVKAYDVIYVPQRLF